MTDYDLVERLRNKDWLWTVPGALREEAATEIDRLINSSRAMSKRFEDEVERLQANLTTAEFDRLANEAEIERLRQSIRALIEVYAPPERKEVLLKEHLG